MASGPPPGEILRDGEIVGLFSPTHGRSCERHEVCGRELKVDDIVRFRRDVIMVDSVRGAEGDVATAPEGLAPETVLKVVLVKDRHESCVVGFLPRHIALRAPEVRLNGRFAQVTELYDLCDVNKHQKVKSTRNNGMAAYVLLENVQHTDENWN